MRLGEDLYKILVKEIMNYILLLINCKLTIELDYLINLIKTKL